MSKRASAAVLLASGALLVAAGPVLHDAVLSAVRVAPWDPDSTTVSTGQGRFIDPTTGGPGTGLVTVTETIKGDPVVGKKHHAAVWTITTRVDTPKTIDLADARQALQLSVHRWTFDRVSNRYVPCCDADAGQGADAFRKFPFHADALVYQLWDPTAGRAFPAQLDGTRVLEGHTFNVYNQEIKKLRVGTVAVPASVLGLPSGQGTVEAEEWYANPQTLTLVDQETGTPVSQTTHEIVTLQMPGDPTHSATALDVTLRTDQDTEERLIKQATGQAAGLALLEGPVPWLLTALGVVLAGIGGLRLRGSRARRTQAPAGAQPDPVAPQQPAVVPAPAAPTSGEGS